MAVLQASRVTLAKRRPAPARMVAAFEPIITGRASDEFSTDRVKVAPAELAALISPGA